MSILITGGAGYIGSHVAHALNDAGERIVVIDDLSNGAASAVPQNTPLIVGNCGDPELLASTLSQHDVTAVMHFAGSISASESVAEPARYHRNNVVNTQMLVEAAIEHGVSQFVFSSTAAVYGQPSQAPVTENARTAPLSPYGKSKLLAEQMLHDAANAHELKLVIFRYFNVAGADRDMRTGQSAPDATHLIRRAVQTAIGLRPEMQVYGTDYDTSDGTCVRDYVNIADVTRAHIDALRYLRKNGQPVTLNCGSGRGVSVHQVIDAVKRVSGADFRVVHAPRRAGDPASVIASPAQARDCLGWRPHAGDLDEIIRRELAWEIELQARNSRSAVPDQRTRVVQRTDALAFEAPLEASLAPQAGLGLKSEF